MLFTTFIAGVLFAMPSFVLQAIATPAEVGDATAFASSTDQGYGIKWTGVIVPGEAETELWGYVDEIYASILAINPDYVAQPINYTSDAGGSESNNLEKRDVSCATMATGDKTELGVKQNNYLRTVGGFCASPKDRCRRTACGGTSATYICGENGNSISVPCVEVAQKLSLIVNGCCAAKGRKGVSGTWTTYAWKVWAGYGNCNHASETWPSNYPYPGGSPNGICYN
ncbi:hypothetical protein QBC44DRAFT_247869 [Cladorrhinum sp. PSN332]|nr:hypothetical protein QBC44DRAFT_247869 [Cladorrhinum sp. PSN332]